MQALKLEVSILPSYRTPLGYEPHFMHGQAYLSTSKPCFARPSANEVILLFYLFISAQYTQYEGP